MVEYAERMANRLLSYFIASWGQEGWGKGEDEATSASEAGTQP